LVVSGMVSETETDTLGGDWTPPIGRCTHRATNQSPCTPPHHPNPVDDDDDDDDYISLRDS
jgi:hypothetical protein